jgi:hypothetical protein
MNFSALNTHAIGVVSSEAIVEGAGTFSAGASTSAQATLHSHTTATVINAVSVVSAQSVIRFVTAIATLGCAAAANVDGYRVQFSNAEILGIASSNANARVYIQAAVSVMAQATNVAVGSRVAYASASLQAECNLTANSGRVTFVESDFGVDYPTALVSASAFTATMYYGTATVATSASASVVGEVTLSASANININAITTASAYFIKETPASFVGVCSVSTAPTRLAVAAFNPITITSSLIATNYIVANTSGTFTGSSIAISVAEKIAVSSTNMSATTSVVASASVYREVQAAINTTASTTTSAYIAVPALAEAVGTCSIAPAAIMHTLIQSNVAAYAYVYTSAYRDRPTTAAIYANCSVNAISYTDAGANGAFNGSGLAISVGHKKAVGHVDLTGFATASAIVGVEIDTNASAFAQATLSSSAYKIAISTGYMNTSASATAIAKSTLFAGATVIPSSVVNATSTLNSAAQAIVLASSTLEAGGDAASMTTANLVASAVVTVDTYQIHAAQADIVTGASVAASVALIIDTSAAISGISLAISVGSKIAVGRTVLDASASLSATVGTVMTATAQISAQAQSHRTSTANLVFTVSNGVYVVNGIPRAPIYLNVGSTYFFDISDPSMSGEPLYFTSVDSEGNMVYATFDTELIAGEAGAIFELGDLDVDTLGSFEYYHLTTPNMGGPLVVGTDQSVTAVITTQAQAQFSTSASINVLATQIHDILAQVSASALVGATAGRDRLAQATVTGTASAVSTAIATINASAVIHGLAVAISVGNKISARHADLLGTADLVVNTLTYHEGVATITGTASVSSAAIIPTIVLATAEVADTFGDVPGYEIPEYYTYEYTTEYGVVVGWADPTPDVRSVTDLSGVTRYYGATYSSGVGYTGSERKYTSLGYNSTYTWDDVTSDNDPYTNGRYAGAFISNFSGSESYYIPGLNTVNVGHSFTVYEVLEDVVTEHPTLHPAVWVDPVTVETSYGPEAEIVLTEVSVLTESYANLVVSAEVAALATRSHGATAEVLGTSEIPWALPYVMRYVYATATLTAGSSVPATATLIPVHVVEANEFNCYAAANAATGRIINPVLSPISASASVTADADTLIDAVAAVVTTQFYTEAVYYPEVLIAAHWSGDVYGWVGSNTHFTTADGTYVFGPLGEGTRSASSPFNTYVQNGVIFREYFTELWVVTIPSYYVEEVLISAEYTEPAFWTNTGYLPNAVIFADTFIQLSFRFSASAEAAALGYRTVYCEAVCSGSSITMSAGSSVVVVRADVNAGATALADASNYTMVDVSVLATSPTIYSVAFVDSFRTASAAAGANATGAPYRTVPAFGTGIVGNAQSASESAVHVRAEGAFTGSSASVSIAYQGAFARVGVTSTASIAAKAWIESNTTFSIDSAATFTEVASKIAHVHPAPIRSFARFGERAVNSARAIIEFTGSSLAVSAAYQRAFTAVGVTSDIFITAEADVDIWARAVIQINAITAITGMGVNSAHAYVVASSDCVATVTNIHSALATFEASAEVVNGFSIVAQEGYRSNGILILVESDNRTFVVEAEDRTIVVESDYRYSSNAAA